MRYWDSSALVPLLVTEPFTEHMRRELEEDPAIVTWVWTRVEIAGAIERLAREGNLSMPDRRASIERVARLASNWNEVVDVSAVRARAITLLGRHALRAADAAHLGSALWLAGDDPSALQFVCLDRRLAEAAEREGLRVLT
jgi:predicted nucleic acid-binding protein